MDEDPLQCPVARVCGGCALIAQTYAEQLRTKTERVRSAFAAWPSLPTESVERCQAAPYREHYRNRAKLAIAQTENGIRVGLHRRSTNEIVDLAPCRVQRPAVQRGIEQLRRWLDRYSLARPAGPVFYTDLREAAGERCHVTLVLDREVQLDTLALDALLEGWGELEGIAVNFGNPASSYPLGPESRSVRGGATFLAPVGPSLDDLQFEVPAGGFFQVAASSLSSVHEAMAAYLDVGGALYDLYCGVGVHGIAVAAAARGPVSVCGVEASTSLVESARRNAERLGVEKACYVAGRVETVLPGLIEAQPPGRVILNPGRSGCDERVIALLAASPATRIAYLSCNPTSLARDLSKFLAAGLRVTRVVPLDLMPQTDQVEVLALLER
jgi:23S rRNA (uracil-5-)-methyltransferase RumA